MKKVIYIILFLTYFIFHSLFTNSPILLNAQSGWSKDYRLTYRPGYSYDPRAVCNGDTIHLVWWEGYVDTMIHEEVFYKRSTDAGETWGGDVLLSIEDEQSSTLPQIAVSGKTVHIIWHEEDFGILYRRSTNGGLTWQNIDSIIPGIGYSSIRTIGDTVYISGISGGTLQFTKSIDGGNNWEPTINVTSASASPTLRNISNNVLNLVVSYRGYPAVEIYNVRSFNAGQTWTDSQVVSDDDGIGSQCPAMDTDDSSGIHITWYDYKYSPYPWTGDIFYRASRDSGNTWEEIDSLTVIHRATASDVLAEGNNLHVVWEDDRHDFADNFEIYYRLSKDLGHIWGPELRLTDAPNWSCGPSLACDGKYLHLFWFDLRNDPSNIVGEIYYKRKDLSYSIEESNKSAFVTNLRFEIYPNPFGQTLDIRLWTLVENSEIKIFDILGKEVISYELKDKGKGIRVDTRHLPCGVYFVQVEAGEESGMQKVVKVE